MKGFNIYFADLTEEAQERLCKRFDTSPEEENWKSFPLTTIEREEEED